MLLFDGSGFVAHRRGRLARLLAGNPCWRTLASIEPCNTCACAGLRCWSPCVILAWDGRYPFPLRWRGRRRIERIREHDGHADRNNDWRGGPGQGGTWTAATCGYANGQGVSLAPGQYTVFFKPGGMYGRPNPKPANGLRWQRYRGQRRRTSMTRQKMRVLLT